MVSVNSHGLVNDWGFIVVFYGGMKAKYIVVA